MPSPLVVGGESRSRIGWRQCHDRQSVLSATRSSAKGAAGGPESPSIKKLCRPLCWSRSQPFARRSGRSARGGAGRVAQPGMHPLPTQSPAVSSVRRSLHRLLLDGRSCPVLGREQALEVGQRPHRAHLPRQSAGRPQERSRRTRRDGTGQSPLHYDAYPRPPRSDGLRAVGRVGSVCGGGGRARRVGSGVP